MTGRRWVTPRRVVALAILALLAPTAVAGVTHALGTGDEAPNATAEYSVENLTVVTAQGRSPDVVSSPGGIEIVNTTSKAQVWSHDDDRCMRYYDAEPVDNSTLLITANCRLDGGERHRLAIEHDWRANETRRAFRIPIDAHDVDRLDGHRYAVAARGVETAYVYNYTAGESTEWRFHGQPVKDSWEADHEWAYDFTEHFPESAGGEQGYDEDFTHLNDIDAARDGRAFLLSPRDFNRVVLVNRSTKEVTWTLGEQDDITVLRGQHHPVLLEEDPPTVLVGDSLNHRVVEYRRVPADAEDPSAGTWERTWTYLARTDGGLNWPRDVERLPNGNTLVMDTGNDRLLEVAPNGTLVWEYETMANPYEADRYAHGEAPAGPTMRSLRDNATGTHADGQGRVSTLDHYHRLAGWVLPVWVGKWAFLGLVGAVVGTLCWGVTEVGLVVRRRR